MEQLKQKLSKPQTSSKESKSTEVSGKDLTNLRKTLKQTVSSTNNKLKDLQNEVNHIQELSNDFYTKMVYVQQKSENESRLLTLQRKLKQLENNLNDINKNLLRLDENELNIMRILESMQNLFLENRSDANDTKKLLEVIQEKVLNVENDNELIKMKMVTDDAFVVGNEESAEFHHDSNLNSSIELMNEQFDRLSQKIEKHQLKNVRNQLFGYFIFSMILVVMRLL